MEKYIKDGKVKSRNKIVVVLDEMQIFNATDEQLARAGWTKYEEPAPTLAQVKVRKLSEIDAYDTSSAVNGFSLNGMEMWLDKSTRVGLMNSIGIEQAAGRETSTLWFGDVSITIECARAIELLSALELYALACYNVTAQHKAEVNALTTIEEVEAYDYTTGYPDKLNLTF